MVQPHRLLPLSRRQGFSLIELMVTVSIIVLLSSISLVVYRQASMAARDAKRKSDLETVRQALVLRKTEGGVYPVSNESFLAYFSVLASLSGVYLNDVMKLMDPKGNIDPYGYRYSSADGTSFTLCAELESDGVPSSSDYCVSSP